MASYPIIPIHTVTDNNGKPVPGAKVYFYAAGTTTELDLFSDNALSNAIDNPVVADAYGRFVTPFFAGGAFKIVATTSADATLNWPGIDNYSTFIQSTSGDVAVVDGGTGASTAEDARTNLGAASASDLSDLSTSLTTVVDIIDNVGGTLGDVAALDLVAPENTTGFESLCIQEERSVSSSVATISAVVNTATTPTNTNGTELFSIAFTPLRDDSTLEFTANINVKVLSPLAGIIYLCRSDSTNAMALTWFAGEVAVYVKPILEHRYSQGSTSTITYSIRAAVSAVDSFTVNSTDWGGTAISSFTIKEIITTPIA